MSRFDIDSPDCQTNIDSLEQIVIPRTADIGGFTVHRALPSKDRRMVGPFIFWDQMGPGEFIQGKGVDVRPHPHIGLSTITYLFDGSMDHKDSLGTNMRIQPGDVNLMTAGAGIVHSERTGEDVRKSPSRLFGIQSWIALPKDKEQMECAFDHVDKSKLPSLDQEGKKIRVISGEAYGLKSPLVTQSHTLYVDVYLNAGAKIPVDDLAEERAVFAVAGKIKIKDKEYEPGQLLIIKPKDCLTLEAVTDTRLLIMGGATADGPRHIWWNFVASTKEKIEEAKERWRSGEFDKVPGDDEEFIPLPEN